MKIRFLTGPKSGQTDHVENNSTTQTLINLGHIEIVTEAPPAPLPVSFGVIYGVQNSGATLQANCPTCHRQDHYVGKPDKKAIASLLLPFLCVHFRGVEVPEATRLAYASAWRFQTFAGPGTGGAVSPNTPDNAPHWVEKDGAIVPEPEPTYWDNWRKH
jgi:hypothetical protein